MMIQDRQADRKLLLTSSEPVAYARFHKAELETLRRSNPRWLSRILCRCLQFKSGCFYLGIPSERSNPDLHHQLFAATKVPESQISFDDLFCDTSPFDLFRRTLTIGFSPQAMVQLSGASEGQLEFAVRVAMAATCPVLVDAGPLGNAIVYEYWRSTSPILTRGIRQTILNVDITGVKSIKKNSCRKTECWKL